jgi:hypothetical protein
MSRGRSNVPENPRNHATPMTIVSTGGVSSGDRYHQSNTTVRIARSDISTNANMVIVAMVGLKNELFSV